MHVSIHQLSSDEMHAKIFQDDVRSKTQKSKHSYRENGLIILLYYYNTEICSNEHSAQVNVDLMPGPALK